ncbi:MAG TPA: integrase core domain-containing protein [Streptosporangiaceae bacterium]
MRDGVRDGHAAAVGRRARRACHGRPAGPLRARPVISDWKADYNHRRRHSALDYQAPAVYAAARTHP